MQSHQELSDGSQDRPFSMCISSKNPLSLDSLPFSLANLAGHGPSHLNSISVQIDTLSNGNITIQTSDPQNHQTVPNKPQERCQYCNQAFDHQMLLTHLDECDMRKISCDRCGERVLIDIFDVHFSDCEMEYSNNQSPAHHTDHQNMGEQHNTIGNRLIFTFESAFSYENLLRLDETIEKKGMTIEQLNEFPVCLYVKSLDGEGFCNICLSDYETGEYIRELSCNHKFHEKCIDKWLEAQITCPTCKKYLR